MSTKEPDPEKIELPTMELEKRPLISDENSHDNGPVNETKVDVENETKVAIDKKIKS